jgi:MoaA/NifB/PqqE/SkfB family radical SAM enzyme
MSEKACQLTSRPPASATQDTFGRVVDYLRISITDRCNERCLYCMPEGYKALRWFTG